MFDKPITPLHFTNHLRHAMSQDSFTVTASIDARNSGDTFVVSRTKHSAGFISPHSFTNVKKSFDRWSADKALFQMYETDGKSYDEELGDLMVEFDKGMMSKPRVFVGQITIQIGTWDRHFVSVGITNPNTAMLFKLKHPTKK